MPQRRRTAATVAALGLGPLALTTLSAAPAAAHGSMGDPVSRVSQCYAEGPESPSSDACEAAVAAGGTQALYDWNGIRIGDAAGRHRELIPDGRLCSANNEQFKGTFTVYLTKPGYDPAQPLAWDDLDLANPVATATDPAASGGFYTFTGTLPERSGTHVLYAVWQRSDSPEAFYSCSDVTFGGGGASDGGTPESAAPAPSASAPSQEQIEAGAGQSTVENHGHGDDDHRTTAEPAAAEPSAAAEAAEDAGANQPKAAGASQNLAETGGDSGTTYLAVGGAAALALGAATLFASVRRKAVTGGRHGR
jgi:chitin-binding protein